MKISTIEIRHLKLPLVTPFETSFGRVTSHETLIIMVRAGHLTGYGESPASAQPRYSEETVETCWYVLKNFLAPALLENAREPSGNIVRGHNMAKAGLAMALCDLKARRLRKSLASFYGGRRNYIPAGISLGIEKTIEALLNRINNALAEGYRRIKIKIKPGWDIDIVRTIRKTFPKLTLAVDANGAYTIKNVRLFKSLDNYRLLMIEQPLSHDDLVDHARLQKIIKTPICLDESIKCLSDARTALALRSCRIINIKQARVGGPKEAIKIHNLCQRNKIPVWCGGLLETGIGRAHNIALASLPNFKLPNDISASKRYYQQDIIEPPFTLKPNGMIKVPQGIGIGCTVKKSILDQYTLRQEIFA